MKRFFKKYFGPLSFYKEMLMISMPIALQQFVSAIVNTLDKLMVSNYGGTSAISGVSIANKYYSAFNMIMFMFAISCSVFIAQFYGAKKHQEIKKVFGISLILTLSFSLIVLVAGIFFKDEILTLFTGGESIDALTYNYGITYLGIVIFSFIPQAITNSLTAAFRSVKLTKVPLYSAVSAALVNALFNYLLINGIWVFPRLGVTGAAIATCIARLVELAILLIYYYIKKPLFYGSFKEIFAFDKVIFKSVIRKSEPIVFAQILTEALGVFMLFVYATLELGNAANVAAITTSNDINDIVVVFIGGLGSAASILVGGKLGANQFDEARKNANYQLGYAVVFSIVASAIMILLRGPIGNLYNFSGDDLKLLYLVMLIQALTFPFLIYSINIIFITRAGGWTKGPLFITNLVYYFIKLPLIILFVWVFKDFFITSIKPIFERLNILPSVVLFIFLIDRFMEIIRSIVAFIIYHKVKWYNNITNIYSKANS